MCLGKYFPTPEVDVVPETNQDHDVIPQGNNAFINIYRYYKTKIPTNAFICMWYVHVT